MSILLWVLQILLALWNMTGGIYMINNYEKLANEWALNALPKPAWIVLGVLQILFALGLVLPGTVRVLPKLTPISAACLALLSLLGIALYVKYAGFPGISLGCGACHLSGVRGLREDSAEAVLTHYLPFFFGGHHTFLSSQSLSSIPSYPLVMAALSVTPRNWTMYPRGPGIMTKG